MTKNERAWMDVPQTVVVAVLLLWLIGLAQAPSWQTFLSPLAAVIFSQALWSGWWYWKKRQRLWFNPAIVVNAVLPALLLPPLHGIVPLITASVLTTVLVTRYSTYMAVLLPGVYGLIAVSLFFGVPVVWRGDILATGAWIACLCTVPFLWRERQLGMVLWFLGAYILFFLFLRGHGFATAQIRDEGVLIFSFIILPFVGSVTGKGLLVKPERWALLVFSWFILLYVLRFTWSDLLLSSVVAAQLSTRVPPLQELGKQLLGLRVKKLSF